MKTNNASKPNPALKSFAPFIGEWNVEGTHPYVPGITLHGRHTFKPIEGGAFIMMHSEIDDSRFPHGIAIFGSDDATGEFFQIYFDERDVSRMYDVSFDGNALTWHRNTPEFSQRFVLTPSADGNTLIGKGMMKQQDKEWEDDIQLTLTRIL